jgi:mono/diheme cytochrome c family protein
MSRAALTLLLVAAAPMPALAGEAAAGSAWSAYAPPAGSPPGRVVFWNYCEACHGGGPGKPGTAALAAKYAGARPALLEQRTDLTPEIVRTIVRSGVSVMPIFRKTELSDADLELLVNYLVRRRAADSGSAR